MRYIVAVGAVLAALLIDAQTGAHAAKYCARYGDGSTNCGFYTMRECRASVSGVGGGCYLNPHYARQNRF